MKLLSEEYDFPKGTKAFGYLKAIVCKYIDMYKKDADTNIVTYKSNQQVIAEVAKQMGTTPTAVRMGTFRCINEVIMYKNQTQRPHENIYRELGVSEIITRLARKCIEEDCTF